MLPKNFSFGHHPPLWQIGGWQTCPKRNTKRGKIEYERLKKTWKRAVWSRKNQEGIREEPRCTTHSRGLKGGKVNTHSDLMYNEGNLVMILKDIRLGVSEKVSYDREGKVTQMILVAGVVRYCSMNHLCYFPFFVLWYSSVSVFFLPRITSVQELRVERGKHRTKAPRERVLIKQLKIYTCGFLWKQYKGALSRNG